jgi:hypothetical protein
MAASRQSWTGCSPDSDDVLLVDDLRDSAGRLAAQVTQTQAVLGGEA